MDGEATMERRRPGWRLVAALLAAAAAMVGVRAARGGFGGDVDVLWHIRAGEHVLRHGLLWHERWGWPVVGKPVIHHEWLSQIGLAGLWSVGGSALVVALAITVLGGLVLALARLHEREGVAPWRGLVAGVVVLLVLSSHFLPRPHLVTQIGVLATLLVLHRQGGPAVGGRSPATLMAWTGAYTLWMNAHSGALLGVALLGVAAAGDWGGRMWSAYRQSGRARWAWPARGAVGVTGAAALGTLVTPWGLSGWWHAVEVSIDPVFGRLVSEFIPLHRQGGWIVALWSLLLSLVLWPRKRSAEPWRMAVLLVLTYGALGASRHLSLLALGVGALLVPLEGAGRERRRGSRKRAAVLGVGAAGAAVLLGWAGLEGAGARLQPDPARWPLGAIRALDALDLGTRPLNDYGVGTVMLWERRGKPVFIDTRGDLYGGALTARAHDLQAARPGWWREEVALLRPDVVVAGRGTPLDQAIAGESGWTPVYCDEGGRLWLPPWTATERPDLPAVQCAAVPADSAIVPLPEPPVPVRGAVR